LTNRGIRMVVANSVAAPGEMRRFPWSDYSR
jgi:hypothetical protein